MERKVIKIRYAGDGFFLAGLSELRKQLGFEFSENGRLIEAVLSDSREITVRGGEEKTTFIYYDKVSFFRAFSLALQAVAENNLKTIRVKPLMKELGTMQNCSVSVLNLPTVKQLVRQHALMGYTYLELYTETTYEIPGEPYFGYKKGRYTKEELKEMVSYARLFGVELVPCIQTLGHLSQLFKWEAYGELHDIRDTLLVDYPRTYELIENMLKSLADCFSTDKINLGMDEAYFMGFGRYHWFIDDSGPDRSLLFIRHLKRVIALAEKYGFTKPAVWFDNLFEINYKGYITPPVWLWRDFSREIRESFPKVRLIFWNYVIRDTAEFKRFVGYIRQLSPDVSFASMAHGYTSFAPENRITERLVDTAREGCLQCGIDDLLVTWWGSKISPFAVLPSYYNYAEKTSESEGIDLEKRCKFLFGYTYSEFCLLDSPNVIGNESSELAVAEGNNLPFYALANDPLCGLLDRHIPDGAQEEYAAKAAELKELSERVSPYAYIFELESILCETLSHRAELGKNIKAAYDKEDKAALKAIAEKLPQTAEKLRGFHKSYRSYFLSFAKPQGSEYWDNSLGGAAFRLEIVKDVLEAYVEGKTERIAELEEERLPLVKSKDGEIISWRDWNGAASSL